MLLKSLPQPVKSINPSLLPSKHFNFKEGRSSSIFWDYSQFSVYSKLYIPSVKLFQTLLFWLICIVPLCSMLQNLSVWHKLTASQQVQEASGWICLEKMAPSDLARAILSLFNPTHLAKNTCKVQSYHNNCRHSPRFSEYFSYMPFTFILSLNFDYIRKMQLSLFLMIYN